MSEKVKSPVDNSNDEHEENVTPIPERTEVKENDAPVPEPNEIKENVTPGPETSDCYKYDESGTMIYTDPTSKVEYVLDSSGTNWVLKSEAENKYKFDGKTYLYTDETTGVKHRWDLAKNDWVRIEDGEQELEDDTEDRYSHQHK